MVCSACKHMCCGAVKAKADKADDDLLVKGAQSRLGMLKVTYWYKAGSSELNVTVLEGLRRFHCLCAKLL